MKRFAMTTWFAGATLACLLTCSVSSSAGEPERPPGNGNGSQKAPEPSPKIIAANTLFRVSDGDAVWRKACYRALLDTGEQQAKLDGADGMMLDDLDKTRGFHFKRGTGFRIEQYTRNMGSRDLVYRLSADEATRRGRQVHLKNLVLVHYSQEGRFSLSASKGHVDTEHFSGGASGGVKIEIYTNDPAAAVDPNTPTGSISCDRLRWRVWRVPAIGSTEMSLFVVSDDPDKPDPIVQGLFTSRRADGSVTETRIRAHGMIFETSVLDHKRSLRNESGFVVGRSNISRSHAIFHNKIRVEMKGTTSTDLIPFQKSPKVKKKADAADKGKKDGKPKQKKDPTKSSHPSLTRVLCNGPAILDFAVKPRKAAAPEQMKKTIPLARRFEFLNGVLMKIQPLDPKTGKPVPEKVQAPGTRARLQCRHLCLGASYAEAIGGVQIQGSMGTTPNKSQQPQQPFQVDAHRVYFDGLTNTLNLLGLPGAPMQLIDERGELSTRLCVISANTQLPSMPFEGPKRLVIRPKAFSMLKSTPKKTKDPGKVKAPKTPSGGLLDLSSAETMTIGWFGPFTSERKRVSTKRHTVKRSDGKSVQQEIELDHEILTFRKNVKFAQSGQGARLSGQTLEMTLEVLTQREINLKNQRVLKEIRTRRLSRVTSHGGVVFEMEDMRAEGEVLVMDLTYDAAGRVISNQVVIEDPKGPDAIVWQGPNAIRGQRFVLDAVKGVFRVIGGAVGRTTMAEPKKPDYEKYIKKEKGPAFSGISMKFEGSMAFQCDGDLLYERDSGILTASRNVLLRQDKNLRIVTDELRLKFSDAEAKPSGKKPEKPDKKPSLDLFSGQPRALECIGRVELTAKNNKTTQFFQCDRLSFDLVAKKGFMETIKKDDEVRIYLHDPVGGTRLLSVIHRLDFDGETKMFDPNGRRYLLRPFTGKKPWPRDFRPATGTGGARK